MNTIAENQGLIGQLWLYLDAVIIDFDNCDGTSDLMNTIVNVFLDEACEE
jgi:hypothetical protein